MQSVQLTPRKHSINHTYLWYPAFQSPQVPLLGNKSSWDSVFATYLGICGDFSLFFLVCGTPCLNPFRVQIFIPPLGESPPSITPGWGVISSILGMTFPSPWPGPPSGLEDHLLPSPAGLHFLLTPVQDDVLVSQAAVLHAAAQDSRLCSLHIQGYSQIPSRVGVGHDVSLLSARLLLLAPHPSHPHRFWVES